MTQAHDHRGAVVAPDVIRRSGVALICLCFASGLVALLGLATTDSTLLPFFPVAVIAIPAVAWTITHPTAGLITVLAAAPLVMRVEEGIQIGEVVYGIYFGGFIAIWLLRQLTLTDQRLIESSADNAALVFLAVVAASIPLTILFGGSPRAAFSELIALSIFGLYFPIRQFCSSSQKAPVVLPIILAWLCLFAAADKLIGYYDSFQNATLAWQIISNRVTSIEGYLLVPTIFMLVFYAYTSGRRRLLYLVGFLFFLCMLVVTQSRGYWIDFAVGVGFLLLVGTPQARSRVFILMVVASISTITIGFVLFRDLFLLVSAGIVDRLVSLGTAFQQDISLINRFHESIAALRNIAQNPVIGYGTGVSFDYFNIIVDRTRKAIFIHNGILGLWYKFGILGVGSILYLWYRSIRTGLHLYRNVKTDRLVRILGLCISVSLVALIPSVTTSNPFYLLPDILLFTILFSLASGFGLYASRFPVGNV